MVQQTRSCKAPWSRSSKATQGSFAKLPQCFVCSSKGRAADECRFESKLCLSILRDYMYSTGRPTECRNIEHDPGTGVPVITFRFSTQHHPHYPTVFNQEISPQIAKAKMVRYLEKYRPNDLIVSGKTQIACSQILLPILREEHDAHIKEPGLIYRARELTPRVTCGMFGH
jgi:hypothetical protein